MVLLCAILEQPSSLSATCRTAGCTVSECERERETKKEGIAARNREDWTKFTTQIKQNKKIQF